MKRVFSLFLFMFTLFLSHKCYADPMYFPGQEAALQKYGRSTDCLVYAAVHNESGYSMVAVQNEQVYQLTILQKINDQEWKLIAINDNVSLNQGRITHVGVDTYEIIDPADKRYAFRIEFDNPPLSNRAFTVFLNEAGEWQIQHIEGTIQTSDKNFSQCILEPSGNNTWKIKYRIIDGVDIYTLQEKEMCFAIELSYPQFVACNPLSLLEMSGLTE